MGNIMVRMGVVIGVLAAMQLGFFYVGHVAHPAIVEPQRPLEEFPLVVTRRQREPGKERTRNWTIEASMSPQADVAVSRIYTKEGHILKFLLAEYGSRRSGFTTIR